MLLAAAGCRNKQIAAELNLTPEKAARWRKRYLQLGLAGLEKDAPRPGRKPRITAKLMRELIAKTTQQTPPNATHWSTRSMAAAMGISAASVRRIWRAHGLKPHRTATFKLSNERQTGAATLSSRLSARSICALSISYPECRFYPRDERSVALVVRLLLPIRQVLTDSFL